MSEVRPPLGPSLSFSAVSSLSSPAVRPQKRRVSSSSDLQFFTPSASSFKPRPYTPNPDSQLKTANRNHPRTQDALGVPPLGMDPHPSDPNVVFIHPPFNVFPDSHLYPDGLTYSLMAENPEWFLDPGNFISSNNSNSNAIPYPPHLEPPRGWCPAKKKDLKERGSEGWPEGEEPRLRCTFCRRTYAGVNAKSMWRRHVFEKHKIAMSNRRDGSDRPRGRCANKENRQLSSAKGSIDAIERVVNLDINPQSENRNVSHKSRFRSQLAAEGRGHRRERDRSRNKHKAEATLLDSTSSAVNDIYPRDVPSTGSSMDDPPLTHHSPVQVTFNDSPRLDTSDLIRSESPPISLPVIPPSPYDPLLTPSFRHSSPRRPSEQPWRFPSPSHPLHSRSRDLSLSFLIRGMHSPLAKVSPLVNDAARAHRASPFASPSIIGTESRPSILDPDSPAKHSKFSPISIFYSGRLPPGGDHTRKVRTVEESPLSRDSRSERRNKRSISDFTDDWLSEVPIDPSTILAGNDPFASIWSTVDGKNDIDNESKSFACADAVSPVLRSVTSLPSNVGLGIGLLDPFTLSDDGGVPSSGSNSDFDGLTLYPPLNDEAVDQPDTLNSSDKENHSLVSTPPIKKRRTNRD